MTDTQNSRLPDDLRIADHQKISELSDYQITRMVDYMIFSKVSDSIEL